MTRILPFADLTSADLINIDQLPIRLAGDTGWRVDNETLEFHDTSDGAQIVGRIHAIHSTESKLGLWYKNGQPFLGMTGLPALEHYTDAPEPTVVDEPIPEGMARVFVNIYEADRNEHGFTIGARTSISRADMEARGQRASGNYVVTVPVYVPRAALEAAGVIVTA